MTDVVEVRNVVKTFGTKEVLRGMSFTVGQGEIVGLLGPNGAGKSTLMRIMLNLLPATSGDVLVFGRHYSELETPIRRVGTLLDPNWLDRRLSAAQMVRVQSARLGMPDDAATADRVLAGVGLSGQGKMRIGKLSLGMRQRLAIALVMLTNPQLLVLDEPVNGLDIDAVLWLRHTLTAFAANGGSVLMSSHLMSEMEHVVNRVVILQNGVTVSDESIATLRTARAVVNFATVGDGSALAQALVEAGFQVKQVGPTAFDAVGPQTTQVFDLAVQLGVRLSELHLRQGTLEDRYESVVGVPNGNQLR